MGLRARLPIRDTEVSELCSSSNITGEDLSDVFQTRLETIGGTGDTTNPGPVQTNTVYAARLDFLSAINRMV